MTKENSEIVGKSESAFGPKMPEYATGYLTII